MFSKFDISVLPLEVTHAWYYMYKLRPTSPCKVSLYHGVI